jgi:hypothetical protein
MTGRPGGVPSNAIRVRSGERLGRLAFCRVP